MTTPGDITLRTKMRLKTLLKADLRGLKDKFFDTLIYYGKQFYRNLGQIKLGFLIVYAF